MSPSDEEAHARHERRLNDYSKRLRELEGREAGRDAQVRAVIDEVRRLVTAVYAVGGMMLLAALGVILRAVGADG